jgi:chemotaxis protein MotB
MDDAARPIIIKKKKVYAAEGHHGGAWKVAYADFVTAMMAFFLLMWLLNATTEEQRKGIADYFNPSIPIAAVSGGGSDALQGDTIFADSSLAKNGTGSDTKKPDPEADAETSTMDQQMEALNKALAAEENSLAAHMQMKMSPEGLVIELTDQREDPLFKSGSASPSPVLSKLTKIVADSFKTVTNEVKIVGHTDSYSFSGSTGYSNWELSTDRANTARRLLSGHGFPLEQISEVSGKSSTAPLSDDPYSPQNRRISITILN